MRENMPPHPEEALKDLTMSLGIALAQWGQVEQELYLLYVGLCRPGPFPNTHSVIYETLVHLDTKLNIIDALVQFTVADSADLSTWSTLHQKIKRKIRRVRNKLAHWRVYRSLADGEWSVFLGPPMHVPSAQIKDFGKSSGGAMSNADLMQHAQNFTVLAEEIRTFRQNILPKPQLG